jgi:hypothetical protein
MTDVPSPSRFKAEMPQIPGVGSAASRRSRSNPLLPLIIGIVVFGIVLLFVVRWFAHSRPVQQAKPVEAAPQIEVPSAPPDPKALLPHADRFNPVIANVSELSKPWSSIDFFIRNDDGQNIPATIVRLPTGSPAAASGYWAFSRTAPYGPCDLEYIRDLDALRTGYDFRSASHPLVGNPCSHTLYDPLKMFSLPGNTWIRGAIVQGSDIRPPLGVEVEVRGAKILAIRTE